MKSLAVVCLGLCWVLVVSGCGGSHEGGGHGDAETSEHGDGHDRADGAVTAVATLGAASGSTVSGSATFTATDGQVTLALKVENCPPGEHAFHIHEVGDCSAEDATSAGGHWNPGGEDHGKWGMSPFHLGDVGNLTVGEDGIGSMALTTDAWSIGTGETNDIVGRAVIVHAGADDFQTQPTGAAGGRIACGVIE